jgi:acyl carrier protein
MTYQDILSQIESITDKLLAQKGLGKAKLTEDTRFLGGDLGIDSLDLAVLITELQTATGKDPFLSGFRVFHTVGELAEMYVD